MNNQHWHGEGRWTALFYSLFYWSDCWETELVPGQDVTEWSDLIAAGGYDDIDRLYINAETIGGA